MQIVFVLGKVRLAQLGVTALVWNMRVDME